MPLSLLETPLTTFFTTNSLQLTTNSLQTHYTHYKLTTNPLQIHYNPLQIHYNPLHSLQTCYNLYSLQTRAWRASSALSVTEWPQLSLCIKNFRVSCKEARQWIVFFIIPYTLGGYDHSDVHDVRESRCVWSHSSCCLPRQLLIVRTLLCMWQQKQMIIEPSLSSTFTTMFTILSDYIIRLAASSSNPPLHVICI